MGYIRHHAIVLTGYNESLYRAHRKARELFGDLATEIVESAMNDYQSFFIAPDGSKEGWEGSETGDARRDSFISWLQNEKEMWVAWAEVQYGDDNGITTICRHSDEEKDNGTQ